MKNYDQSMAGGLRNALQFLPSDTPLCISDNGVYALIYGKWMPLDQAIDEVRNDGNLWQFDYWGA